LQFVNFPKAIHFPVPGTSCSYPTTLSLQSNTGNLREKERTLSAQFFAAYQQQPAPSLSVTLFDGSLVLS